VVAKGPGKSKAESKSKAKPKSDGASEGTRKARDQIADIAQSEGKNKGADEREPGAQLLFKGGSVLAPNAVTQCVLVRLSLFVRAPACVLVAAPGQRLTGRGVCQRRTQGLRPLRRQLHLAAPRQRSRPVMLHFTEKMLPGMVVSVSALH